MNKAITDGLVLMPPAFEYGLDVWSSGDGTPGSSTWAGSPEAALVTAEQDFGSCLEVVKTTSVTKLRFTGETPLLPGCYLRVRARVKAMSGNLPAVRIAGWAGGAGGAHVSGVVETGPSVQLTSYGRVETVEAIVGTGYRTGVDMEWGKGTLYGHLGLDLTGPNGGVVRIDDIEIEDVTSVFLRTMMDWIDVRDYGAKGDGVTNAAAAFEAADAAADAAGRTLLVSAGTYHLNADVTLEAPVRFEGRVTMPVNRRLALTRNFDLPSYAAAFGDEELGFKKAFQALLNFSDHDSLDLKGRRIEVTAPIDMQAAVNNKTTFATRRVIRNGQFNVIDGPAWVPTIVTSQANFSSANPTTLSSVANIANIPAGALVEGTGVGREVYVTSVNVGAGTLTLSKPPCGAAGTQVYTFTRFKYALDFGGFASLSQMALENIDVACNGYSSGILLPPSGIVFQIRDSFISNPRSRGITSTGSGCQGLMIDRCQFLSAEGPLRAQDRQSIAFNTNANDVKVRDCRALNFRHFAVMTGAGNLISGNHFFQGDGNAAGVRLAGLVLVGTDLRTTITGNSIDNCFVEWTNEHEVDPGFLNQLSFGGLTITGNVFTASDVAPWFSWIVIKPYGAGHFIQSLNVTANVFKSFNGSVDRVDKVDTTYASLDNGRMRSVWFEGNTFTGVTQSIANPVIYEFNQSSAATSWIVDAGAYLPFGGWARTVESVMPEGMITGPSGERRSDQPYVQVTQGATKQQVTLNWAAASKGRVQVKVRMDNPI
ncbi:right-handed parallel beta-helix repeat-containing protein [Defluviimonas sp. WL0024]|uniref:Right-handed parallel beta-helix repeat-containing protein n=1 Tax=Albidovulum salinarum TaxID=2984153 RepID=A0ABT2X9Z0_9RHOB|nr:glycosyl hydrolase family 28-related protein [Defluviimonas sp. WL0024]MCU9849847.1 right-handed parallel beta-helix repeat-containing protein [Defluviimonas sp. WL0024]